MERILVVDDEEAVRETLREFLEKEGFDVVLASDGYEAMENARERTIDAAVVDIMRPKIDGMELIYELQEEILGLPMLTICGGSQHSHAWILTAQELGAKAGLTKPFTRAEFLRTVKKLLEGPTDEGCALTA